IPTIEGFLAPDTVYVRLASGQALGNYTGNIDHLDNGVNRLRLPIEGAVVDITPADFRVTVRNDSIIRLTWVDNSGIATRFDVERKEGPLDNFALLASTNNTFYDDAAVTDTITYFYRVKILTSLGDSVYTEELGAQLGLVTSAENNWLMESSTLGPNPALDEILLEMNNGFLGKIKARILDLQGTILREDIFEKKRNNIKYSVDLDDLESGLYLLWIDTNKGSASWRFVKE
ncbi:MAG: T9SS type A sorting domain-containing protein, partial [Bacteroidota bacterium]